ncbi:hypothetical protein OM076_29045 [Solirubrobacter ginsenosidimutans]|uniref:Uncharacterized protein n=1 Tax=Solirubrobacter ginsenosidimutans TaxID=490573 RepID=A0A9X3MXJ1_9ACTN|nr:hypothetical protein [Solirubrobacter ginsenosidimutans]MDA0164352.1 hypothetical protein [Solirubrobacter ginsenosidimutans]
MSEPFTRPHYEIRVRGRLGPTLLEAFPSLAAEPSEGETVLAGALPDQSALYGVLRQLEALGLELVEVRRFDRMPGGPELVVRRVNGSPPPGE